MSLIKDSSEDAINKIKLLNKMHSSSDTTLITYYEDFEFNITSFFKNKNIKFNPYKRENKINESNVRLALHIIVLIQEIMGNNCQIIIITLENGEIDIMGKREKEIKLDPATFKILERGIDPVSVNIRNIQYYLVHLLSKSLGLQLNIRQSKHSMSIGCKKSVAPTRAT